MMGLLAPYPTYNGQGIDYSIRQTDIYQLEETDPGDWKKEEGWETWRSWGCFFIS
jgi:hypothetical protein